MLENVLCYCDTIICYIIRLLLMHQCKRSTLLLELVEVKLIYFVSDCS